MLRFTHKLGLQGYSEMKIHFKWEDKQQNSFDNKEIEKHIKILRRPWKL
ncbi:hypothetical protein [Clostridium beijerinckii]|nr:hypothetical protein [Clostridium beijerinckii]